ncbi:unnamed protein product [Effrenium voratum]|nr:unnamed protein product [Effrenium voratum]
MVPAPVQSPLGAGKAKLMHAEVLAAGQDHSLAILHPPGLEKSVLYGWGGNVGKPEDCFTNVSPNVVIPEALIDDIMQVAAGRTHSLALRSTGELFTWGRNTFGQLGDCSILGKTQPTKVMNLVRQVAAGVDFSLAVLESGTVMAFGCNAGGRLGNGDARHQQAPTPILEGVRSVTAGHSHCFALLENGQCLGWGANQHGCIRQSGEPAVLTPVIVEVADVLSIKEIKAGSSATLALLSSGEYAVWGRNWQRQISCLTELGATVQLNWRPSDPVQGEVAVDAIADASTYDVKSLMASTAALKQGKTPRSAAEVAAAFAGRSAAEAAMLRSEARAKAAEAAGKAAFNAARTAGMTVPVSAHLAAVAAAQAARDTAEVATTCDEGLPPFAAECAFLAGQAAGLGPLEAAEEAAAGAAKAAFKPPEEKPGPGDASAAMRAAKAAAVAFGVAGERANWIAAVSAGRLVGEAMIFEGQQPYQMAKLASAARSQLAIAEAERGMQRLEDAALEAGRAAHRLAVELGMGEDGALDATAVCASQLAEDFAAAAWKSLEQVAAWAGRAAYGALSHTGATEELMADLAAMCAGRAAAEFLVEEGRRVEEAPTAAGLAASRASEACGSYAVAPKVQRAGKAAGAAAQLLGLSPAECATCAARAAALCASEGRVRAELLAKMAGMAAGNAALAVGLELTQAAEAAQRSAETEGYDAGLTADVAERAGRLAYDKVLGIIHDSDSEEEHEEEVKEETVVEESEPEEVFQGFQSLEEADAAFEAWMFTACERYGKSIHKKVHAKAKNLGRAYALVWQAYRKSHGHQSRMSDLDKDDHALMAFHAKLYKVRAVLRYQNIPHKWIRSHQLGVSQRDVFKKKFPKLRAPVIPVLVKPDGSYVNDSTPLLQELEREYAYPDGVSRSVYPANACCRFLSLLLEDFGDEWMTKVMFAGRFQTEADAKFGAEWQILQSVQVAQSGEQAKQVARAFAERQVGRKRLVGCEDWDTMEYTLRQVCKILDESVSAGNGFLFGDRPTVGDLAIYGQLTQSIFDPLPQKICQETPSVMAWVMKVDDLSGLEVPEDALHDVSPDWRPPKSVMDMLSLCGETYMPFLLANEAAIKSGEKQVKVAIRNGVATHVQPTFKYQVLCLQVLREEFNKLRGSDLECEISWAQDAISFLHADRIPGGAEQFGWPPEAVSIHTGTAAVHAAITQAAKATTNDQNENLFAGPPPVLNAQLAKLAGKEDLQVLHGPGMSETLRWPQERAG